MNSLNATLVRYRFDEIALFALMRLLLLKLPEGAPDMTEADIAKGRKLLLEAGVIHSVEESEKVYVPQEIAFMLTALLKCDKKAQVQKKGKLIALFARSNEICLTLEKNQTGKWVLSPDQSEDYMLERFGAYQSAPKDVFVAVNTLCGTEEQ